MRPTVGIVSICMVGGGSMIQSQAQAQAIRAAQAPAAPGQVDAEQPQASVIQRALKVDAHVIDRNVHRAPANSDLPDLPGGAARAHVGGSGSLLKAAIAAQADPAKAKLSEVSWTAVPEPEPKTL